MKRVIAQMILALLGTLMLIILSSLYGWIAGVLATLFLVFSFASYFLSDYH